MSLDCCQGGLLNSGLPSCVKTIGVIKGLVVTPLRNTAGSLNSIDLTSFNETAVTALLRAADANGRWYPWVDFKNVDLPLAETVFETAGNDEKSFLRQGLRSFVGELWDAKGHHVFGGLLKKLRCKNWGVYLVDEYDQLIGLKKGTDLFPIPVNGQSFDPMYMFKVDATTNKVMWNFDFAREFKEELLYIVPANEVGATFSFLEMVGLIDGAITVSNIVDATSLTFDVQAVTNFASGLLPNFDILGLAAADFAVFNVTTNLAITPIAVTGGGAAGVPYSFDVASQTASDVIRVSFVLASGYIGSATFVHP